MANILNTRIQLKYDSFTNWKNNNPTLLSGEVAIVYAELTPTQEVNSVVTPQILFKVGPGAFNDLPWASGRAADVYNWAKQSGLSISKDGTGNVVSGIEWDATANNGKGGIKFTTASVATSEDLENVQGRLAALEAEMGDEVISSVRIMHNEESLFNILTNYLLNIDYDTILAFDTSEIVIGSIPTPTTAVLGQAMLGCMVLA